MANLLVVDFDYFFVNPLEGGLYRQDPNFLLYDWGHRESSLFRTEIWPSRAACFLANNVALPGVDIPTGWWDRFNISAEAVCTVSDSNAFSGVMELDADAYEHVWLFDAHHDLYGVENLAQAQGLYSRGLMSCENWMFFHFLRGSKLHWRWPQWHQWASDMADDIPDFVDCDAQRDNMDHIDDIQFDAVSICRSGCWVPSWCDGDFETFVLNCPANEIIEVEADAMAARDWFSATRATLLSFQGYLDSVGTSLEEALALLDSHRGP